MVSKCTFTGPQSTSQNLPFSNSCTHTHTDGRQQGLVGPMWGEASCPRTLWPSWDWKRWPFGPRTTSSTANSARLAPPCIGPLVKKCWNESVCVSCTLSITHNAQNTLYALLITYCYDRNCQGPIINHPVRRVVQRGVNICSNDSFF